MKKKQAPVYTLPHPVYTPGSGFLILSGKMQRRAKDGTLFCTLELQSLVDQEPEELTVGLVFYDGEGSQIGEMVPYSYPAASLKRDECFGGKAEIPVPYPEAASFDVAMLSLAENGDLFRFSTSSSVHITERVLLEDAFDDPELSEQYRVRYGQDCRYLRGGQEDLWFCACGAINNENENSCHLCRRAKKAMTNLNLDSLRAEVNKRQQNEPGKEKKAPKEQLSFKKPAVRRWFLLVPLVLLMILLLATLPAAAARERHYKDAVSYFEAGNLDAAEEEFTAVSAYKDSSDYLSRQIPYQRAQKLLQAAEAEDLNALVGTGHSRTEVSETMTPKMVLYTATAEAFEALGNYEDSAALASRCRNAVVEEAERLIQEDYDEALALLNDGYYSKAKEAFRALGDYSNSKTMVQECAYRKALSLFRFLSSYDVSRMFAHITVEPGETSIFSLPASEALRLGSGCVEQLRAACGGDAVDVRLEDEPPEGLATLKEALADFFRSLGDYSDSADFPERIVEETDYTREFFMLCSNGDLVSAWTWLNEYKGDFPERDKWVQLLKLYLPFCSYWNLYSGDSTLIPFSVGYTFTCNSVVSRILLEKDSAVMRLSFGDGYGLTFDLPTEFGETLFVSADYLHQYGYYIAAVNAAGRLGFTRYSDNWDKLSACEYEKAE